jgi:ADP-ribosylglycohydrolase
LGDIWGARGPAGFSGKGLHPQARWSDGTVLTLALAEHVLDGTPLEATLRAAFQRHPYVGYGWHFMQWATAAPPGGPYGSLGNGAALRVSAVAWAFDGLDRVLAEAARTAAVTHDHAEGVRAAQAVAAAIYLARTQPEGRPLAERQATVRELVGALSGYDLEVPPSRVHDVWPCDFTAAGSVPPALIAAMTAVSWEDAVETAIRFSTGCTRLASLTGAVAEGLFGVPAAHWEAACGLLHEDQRGLLNRFGARFGPGQRWG